MWYDAVRAYYGRLLWPRVAARQADRHHGTMWMSFLVVLYLPTLLLLAIAHSGALDGLSCSTAGFCQLLGAPFGMNVEEPTTGDVLVIGVVLGVSWLSAAALLARRSGVRAWLATVDAPEISR